MQSNAEKITPITLSENGLMYFQWPTTQVASCSLTMPRQARLSMLGQCIMGLR